MAEPTYIEQLNDPRWQRKRLEIMERDNFACSCCGTTFLKLNVHHLYYLKGLKPWEYDNEAMVTLCDSCHEFAHNSLTKISALISFQVLKNGMDLITVTELLNTDQP